MSSWDFGDSQTEVASFNLHVNIDQLESAVLYALKKFKTIGLEFEFLANQNYVLIIQWRNASS
jgi:hypothetical protein